MDTKKTKVLKKPEQQPRRTDPVKAIRDFMDFMETYSCAVTYTRDGRDADLNDGVLDDFRAVLYEEEDRTAEVSCRKCGHGMDKQPSCCSECGWRNPDFITAAEKHGL